MIALLPTFFSNNSKRGTEEDCVYSSYKFFVFNFGSFRMSLNSVLNIYSSNGHNERNKYVFLLFGKLLFWKRTILKRCTYTDDDYILEWKGFLSSKNFLLFPRFTHSYYLSEFVIYLF